MGYDTQEGLPSAWLLLFTLMLWTLFAAILLSNRKSRINQWGFISGMLFSLGVLKEYVYFGLLPQIARAWPDIPADIYQGIYSVMTAILYYWCMPCTLVLAFHFGELPARRPRLYAVCRILVFVPGLIWGLAVPYQDTRYYQLAVPAYFPAATVYNWIYGIGVTLLMLMTLYRERLSARFQQKKFIAVTTLLPLWYWLRYTVLTVADTGCGISREEQARLFQPYYTTKGASFQHMGLGLYYCFHVMEKQHGGIRVKSIPGRGTTFFLYFPLKKNRCEVRYESEKNTDSHCGG